MSYFKEEEKCILTYEIQCEDNREAKKIQFELPIDLNIKEFKRMCMRMAYSLGYANNSIVKTFGHDEDEDDFLEKTKFLLNG